MGCGSSNIAGPAGAPMAANAKPSIRGMHKQMVNEGVHNIDMVRKIKKKQKRARCAHSLSPHALACFSPFRLCMSSRELALSSKISRSPESKDEKMPYYCPTRLEWERREVFVCFLAQKKQMPKTDARKNQKLKDQSCRAPSSFLLLSPAAFSH